MLKREQSMTVIWIYNYKMKRDKNNNLNHIISQTIKADIQTIQIVISSKDTDIKKSLTKLEWEKNREMKQKKKRLGELMKCMPINKLGSQIFNFI